MVDRNVGAPYVIYVGNGADFSLMPNGWDNALAGQLDLIRAGLRKAVSAANWIDPSGRSISAAARASRLNLISMRGS